MRLQRGFETGAHRQRGEAGMQVAVGKSAGAARVLPATAFALHTTATGRRGSWSGSRSRSACSASDSLSDTVSGGRGTGKGPAALRATCCTTLGRPQQWNKETLGGRSGSLLAAAVRYLPT